MIRALSIAILIIFLLGSMGMTISKHYCQGKLYSTNVGVLVDGHNSCDMNMPDQQCAAADESGNSQNCCNDKIDNLKINDNYNPVTFDWKPLVAVIGYELSGSQYPQPTNTAYSAIEASPPAACKDLIVFVQSFLC